MSFISPVTNKIFQYAGSASQYIADHIGTFTPSNEKLLKTVKWVGEKCSGPQNRLILGATALMSQPFIDLYNKNVDEKTREISAARTAAKIIVGTATGFTVRYLTIAAIEKFKKFFAPTIPVSNYKQYSMALGNFLALAVMLITNFVIDAPGTKALTNKFTSMIEDYHKNKALTKNTEVNGHG